MDSRDVDICKKMSRLLYDAAPAGSRSIVMRAQLAEDEDQAKFEFDAIAENGESSWFLGSASLNRKLLGLLVEHRRFFVSQNQPKWKSFALVVDVDKGRFSLDLKYD
ncbi:hypothetical protein [Burkholderia ambifaria]|uniref:hypothetical protein n=1 Tax=Burkholderia ambifaria TaxID=152480 RepID=UPI00158B132E|nr:hypothetical protein [Burkholderia ambifaria]UEP22969.1 hypothetical protein LL999_22180 [Burkholderia ambifaria]WDR86962.1 hypothetical protein OR986_11535 [Burkholderia ambifaria]WDR99641.1 hypothetical protein OR985_16505 [Burkholderia ambifaria]